MKNVLSKIAHHYRKIPDKKPYIEFVTALLSVPVLLTVIVLNLNALRSDKTKETPPVATTEKIYVTIPAEKNNPTSTTEEPCTPGIGLVDISSPEEEETITDNPVQVSIDYKQEEYCEAVWSYRINSGKWSDYDDKSIALYNLPEGNIKLDLRIKSVVSSDSDSITRNFIYKTSSTSAN